VTIDALLAAGSLVGLLIYSSIAIAIYHATGDRLATREDVMQAICGVLGAYGTMWALLAMTVPHVDGTRLPAALFIPVFVGGLATVLTAISMALTESDATVLGVRSALWLFAFPVYALGYLLVTAALMASRVPLACGRWLARRFGAPVEDDGSVAERIAELERELGIGDETEAR